MATWRREDIPYDAMGDYSSFHFEPAGKEEDTCEDWDREKNTAAEDD